MSKLSLYSQLARPFTLLPPLLGIVSGSICAFGSAHNPDPARGVTLRGADGHPRLAVRQLHERGLERHQPDLRPGDRPHEQARPAAVTGAISVREAWVFSAILYALALVPTWLVVPFPYVTLQRSSRRRSARTRPSSSICAGRCSLSSTRPRRWADEDPRHAGQPHDRDPARRPAQSGGLGDGRSVAYTEPWYIGGVFGLFLIGAASTKDFADMEGDRAGGCKTLPIRLRRRGRRRGSWRPSS